MKNVTPYRNMLLLGMIIALSVGCKPEPIVDPPLPPLPIPDCSYSFTEMTVDTIGTPPLPGVTGIQYDYYEGFEIQDISISPNDPNKLVASIRLYDGQPYNYILLVVDLCTGVQTAIHETPYDITSVDWGDNDRIVFPFTPGYAVNRTLSIINPDGSGLTTLPPIGWNRGPVWAPDGQSFLVYHTYNQITRISLSGEVLSEDIGLGASDFDFLPDGRIGYIGGGIGIFDPTDGSTQILSDQSISSNTYSISYSPFNNSLLWTTDSIVAYTDIGTGQRTELALAQVPNRWYMWAAASKGGYMAYVANVLSLPLSNANMWYKRHELRFINADGTDERTLILDIE